MKIDKRWQRRADDYHRVLATSPDGTLVAAQWDIIMDPPGHAAVWDVATKQIVWEPEGATAIAWVGDELLATRFDQVKKREVIDWYDKKRARKGSVVMEYPLGSWLTHAPILVGNAEAKAAAVLWTEQTECGFELVRRERTGWKQLAGWGFTYRESNYALPPVFSDDARYVAIAFGAGDEWWAGPKTNREAVSGVVMIVKLADGGIAFVETVAKLKRGAGPGPKASVVPEVVACSGKTIEIKLQTGDSISRELGALTFKTP